jgi:hypothetical protein
LGQQDSGSLERDPRSGGESRAGAGLAWRERAKRPAAAAFLLLAVGYSIHAGLRVDRPARWRDGRFLFLSGRLWLEGESPYDRARLLARWPEHFDSLPKGPFLYPPTLAVVAVPLGLLPSWPVARRALDVLNVAALAACLGLAARLLVAGVPASITLGQTTLVALAGALGALHFAARGHALASGLCVVLASIKPQLTLLPLLLLPLERRWHAVGWAALGVAVASALPLAAGSGAGLAADLRAARELYASHEANFPEALVGGVHLLARARLDVPEAALPLAGAALVLGFHLALRARPPSRARGLLALSAPFLVTGLCSQIHGYDTALYLVPVASLALLPPASAVALAPALVLAARPQVVTRSLELLGRGGDEHTGPWLASWGALAAVVVLAAHARGGGVPTPPSSSAASARPAREAQPP